MKSRSDVVEKIAKVLRLAHGAGTAEEAHAALAHAQRLMYAHDVEEQEVVESAADAARDRVGDEVADTLAGRVAWREYVGAVVAENFRCAYVISSSRATGAVRLVFVGKGGDARVARDAYVAATAAAETLASEYCAARPPGDETGAARDAFLTGFVAGLYQRLRANVAAEALAVAVPSDALDYARSLANGGPAEGGQMSSADRPALESGYESGFDFGSTTRRVRD